MLNIYVFFILLDVWLSTNIWQRTNPSCIILFLSISFKQQSINFKFLVSVFFILCPTCHCKMILNDYYFTWCGGHFLYKGIQMCRWNTVASNHANSDHVPSFSCLNVWNVRQVTSDVYDITVTTSTYHSRRCGRL